MSAIPNYKDIINLIKKGATLDAQVKIMELREYDIELREENVNLKKKIKQLESQLDLTNRISFNSPFYYLKDDKIPFCPRCWESDKKAIHLIKPNKGVFKCPDCKIIIQDEDYTHKQGRITR